MVLDILAWVVGGFFVVGIILCIVAGLRKHDPRDNPDE
jgi:hypothetical protein